MLHLRIAPDSHDADLAAPDAEDSDLVTEILIALLTDARADPAELPDGIDNRGWYDDSIAGEPLGSLLWLLEHAPPTAATARRAERYAAEALAYLTRSKRARTIEAIATVEHEAILLTVHVDGQARVRALPVR